MGCCGNRCTATPNNDKDEGDPMELNWAYTEAILNWGDENEGDVEDESDKTILCVESEVMLRH